MGNSYDQSCWGLTFYRGHRPTGQVTTEHKPSASTASDVLKALPARLPSPLSLHGEPAAVQPCRTAPTGGMMRRRLRTEEDLPGDLTACRRLMTERRQNITKWGHSYSKESCGSTQKRDRQRGETPAYKWLQKILSLNFWP